MPKNSLKFVLNKRDGIIAFNLNFMLLPVEVNFIIKEQGCKKDAFIICGTGCIKIILVLLTKIITLYMWAFIVQVKVFGFENVIV